MTHDLTVRQREELKELIKEVHEKVQQDETGSFMYRVRGPPWMWRIKKLLETNKELTNTYTKQKIECRSYERR